MSSQPRFAVAFFLSSSLCLAAASAHAQEGQTYVEQAVAAGQSLIFKDDPLAALPLGAGGVVVPARPSGARMGLLRPRTQFVLEMLKSVEAL